MFRLVEEEIRSRELDPVSLPGADGRPPAILEHRLLADATLDAAAADGRRGQRRIQPILRIARPITNDQTIEP